VASHWDGSGEVGRGKMRGRRDWEGGRDEWEM
jgi:hypothetical protein